MPPPTGTRIEYRRTQSIWALRCRGRTRPFRSDSLLYRAATAAGWLPAGRSLDSRFCGR